MDKNSINQNKAIQDGLEKFLDQEIDFYNVKSDDQVDISTININKKPQKPAGETMSQRQQSVKHEPIHRETRQREPIHSEPLQRERNQRQPIKHEADSKKSEQKTLKTEFASTASDHSRMKGNASDFNQNRDKDDWDDSERESRHNPINNSNPGGKNPKTNMKSKKNNRKTTNTNNNGKGNKNSKNKKNSKLKKVLIILLIAAIAIFLWWYIMVGRIYNKMNYEKADELASGSMKEDGVINVLLIGNDSRQNGEDGRSDAMILVSISNKTKTIHMTSLLRDMYVEIPGHDSNRLNAAYSYGGATLLCETIEQNLGIEVNRYALVNFQAFANLVDAVGGVDLDVTNEEVQWINAYLNEYNLLEGKEITTDYLDTSLSGEIHLNGPQALAYSRNRYIGTDFGRTERQRKVLGAVMKKMPLTLATNSDELINGLFPNLTTNLTKAECYELSLQAEKFVTYDLIQSSIPAEGTYENATIRKMSVLKVDFDANKKILQQEIYGKENEEKPAETAETAQ